MSYYYDLFIYIVIYSFLGWCVEVGYAYKHQRKFVNRGFLFGPLCPIYGFCSICLISLLDSFKSNTFILFIMATLLTSFIEYFTGYLLEKIFKKKYWDYTEDPFNLHGRICLPFSLMWGGVSVLCVKVIQPILCTLIFNMPYYLHFSLFISLSTVIAIDFFATLYSLIDIKKISSYIQLDNIIKIDMKKYWINRK